VELAGTGTGDQKDARKPENWPLIIRTLAREDRDPEIAAVIKCANHAEFSTQEAIKAWSLVDFLLQEHKDKFVEFCKDLRAQDDNGEKSLHKVFGWTLEDLDDRWRAFVKIDYAGK
jgi:hypothetical protein